MSQHSLPSGRRTFLKGASLTAAAAAGLMATKAAAAAEGPAAGKPDGHVNARAAGAAGDGRTDDTAALKEALAKAKARRSGAVFLPAGTYRVSETLHLPSDIALVGAGRGLTKIQAVESTLFSKFRPDPRTHEMRQRRTLITTESVSTVREEVAENIAIKHLTIDWNHCPTDGFGHSVALMDSCDRGLIHDVAFLNCLPSDHPQPGENLGNRFRCECVMYSNSRYGMMDNVLLTDSGYRPLSVSYGSRKITFQNGTILAVNPPGRHVFSENHGDGLPRDETFVRAEIIFLNSTFILEGGNGHDGICSHTGTTHVENCDFFVAPDVRSLRIVLRPFDGSRNCTYINNRFHLGEERRNAFSVIATTRDLRGINNEAITFAGNVIDYSVSGDVQEGARPIVHFPAGDRRVLVRDNRFAVRWHSPAEGGVIHLTGTAGFSVSDNLMELQGEAAENVTAIRVEDVRQGQVCGNSVVGGFRHGVAVTGDSDRVVVAMNNLSDATREAIRNESEGGIEVGQNI